MLRNIDYFYEIYRTRSFSRAAANLFISQSALSLTIKKAEERIGAKIFDRSTTPIQLTPFGEKYIEAIEQIKGITNRLQTYIGGTDQNLIGNVSIAASHFTTSYLLGSVLSEFHKQYPLVNLDVYEYSGSDLGDKLMDGTYDLIISGLQPQGAHAKSWPLYQENFSLAVPLNYREVITAIDRLPQGQSPLDACTDIPFILLRRGNSSRTLTDQLMFEHNFNPNIILELNQQSTACSMAASGLGAVICSEMVIRQICGDKVKVYPFSCEQASRVIYISIRRQDNMTIPMIKFIETAQKILRGSEHNPSADGV